MIEIPPVADLVAGEWRECDSVLGFALEDPATGTPTSRAVGTSYERTDAAIAAADAVHRSGAWSARTADERADLLDAIAAEVEVDAARIVELESFATGVPLRQTSILAVILGGAFRLAAGQLRAGWLTSTMPREDGRTALVERLPWGPAACLVPWNAPAPMAAHKIANALAAGCPTIVKPSEYAPHGTQLLAGSIQRALAAAGLPDGLFQLVHGDAAVGGQLVADPRIRAVSFTGGLAGGRAVASACGFGIKPVQLELGGNNPLVVLPDADTGTAARAAADLLTTLNGQWCRALGRLIVPADRADEIVGAVLARLAGLTAGDPLDQATDFGPLIHSGHRERVAAAVDELVERGGTVHRSLGVPVAGNFLSPTLVTGVDPADTEAEIFGPVAAVHTYADLDEAVALANGTDYGLEAYVVGADEDAALAVARRIRAGEVKVNGSSIMSLHLFTPRPAWGLSGISEEGTAETLRFFTNARVVGVEGGFALHGRP
ncbi:phenylacetaldehyde dehydrogenase [Allocatelliglobosispora scoriae]|uniref:Phenylacetaldehyde dehydrogenase n=1 Tax=Allocatelliglobosispora scoriae TaxID=643052 RepID=A0A841BYZ2_9ACTN|nr:aldehyde dehydrogenase family protein [Allocatelliglobosispora scoriae]MBB5873354.1 phenylacetaldehyde dehydrogenase [Allocatelliglobosispora scoriae]